MIRTGAEAILLWIFGCSGFGVSALGLDNMFATIHSVDSGGSHVAINESTLLPLGLFVGGLVTTTIVVWKIATHAKDIESQLENLNGRVQDIEKRQRKGF